MCGIVGLYGDNTHINSRDLKAFLLEGLYVDALRGQESTGIARLPRKANQSPEVFKRALSGPDFVQNKGAMRIVEKMADSYGYIGHNRSSTRGQVEDDNAHPFQYKHITLVHNGTVYNSSSLLPGNQKCDADNPVDSAQVAWSFAQVEPDTLLHKMNGPFSLVWWDSRDNTLHFARNSEKPMYWAVNAASNMMYYASELKMLTWLLDRNDIKVKPQMKYTAPGQHYIFKNPKNVEDYTLSPFLKAAAKNPKAGGSGTSKEEKTPAREFSKETQSYLPAVIPPVGHKPQRGGPGTDIQSDKTASPTTPTTTPTTPETQTTTKSPGTTSTGIIQTTGDVTIPEEQKRFFLTKDGKKHPAESERIKRGYVGTLLAGITDEKRKKQTRELAQIVGVEPFKAILGVPKAWMPYENESGIGIMFLRHGRANIQVFNVSFAMWNKCTSCQAVKAIPLQIVSYRMTYDDTVFIGEISMEAVERVIRGAMATSGGPFRGFLDDEFDNENDLIEVGMLNPKYVTKKEFHKLVEGGCWKCDRVILESEASQMGWYGADEDWPVCSTCFSQPVVKQEMEDATAMMDPPRGKSVH